MIYLEIKFRIAAVGVTIGLMGIVLRGIVPMDSPQWQGPDVPVPGEGAVFEASYRLEITPTRRRSFGSDAPGLAISPRNAAS